MNSVTNEYRELSEFGPQGPSDYSGNGLFRVIDFERYLDLVRNNKLAIAGVLALFLAVGLILTLLATEQFRATTRVEIGLIEQNVTDVEGAQSDNILRDRTYLPTQYQLLESQSLADRVVRELDLANDDEFLEAFDIQAGQAVNIDRRLSNILLRNIEIGPIPNSTLVDISFVSPSGPVSAKIANAWADAYIAENLDRRFGATIEARDFLEDRLQQTRQQLEQAERELIEYASDRGLVSLGGGNDEGDSANTASQTLVATELEQLNQALLNATAERISAEAAFSSRQGSPAVSADSPAVNQMRQRRSEIEVEIAELRSRFQNDYPPLRSLEAQLAELESSIRREESNSISGLRANYNEALARERNLRQEVEQLRSQFLSQRQDSVQYNILQREVDTNREIYAGLLQRFREIGVVGVGESNIVVVDPATAPRAPFSPNLFGNLLVALALGVLFVAVGLYLRDLFDQSLRDPRQVPQRLGIPLLASIPRTPEDDIVDDLSESFSELYESYFSLTSSIAYHSGGSVPQSVMVTSSRPGEGKSLSAIALAYLLARQGKRVLLVDADMRKSGIHKYLEGSSATGVAQYLQGDDDWRAMVSESHPLDGFHVISAGRKPHSVAELLSTGRLRGLLDEAESAYDHVIVDGPPVLGLVDSPLMGAGVGGVVFVIEANEGKWRYIESAISRLRESNADIIGATVTKLDSRNTLYGYGDSYGYGYGNKDVPADREVLT
ncbi:GumC family protein [Aurantiacibacter sp. MUD61]|uniref:GumC family protein n=1 Tax=Aurantiacibacter sp. MUD61 TaxID=3009083 RepID=UPI0022F0BE83|nr:polysaccharide biosynthesis tyrosine autokinase [Aurantiacibacter sp. MUD61]